MNTKIKYDVAVIGGGPAGASSALYAAKLRLKTILFEKQKYPRKKPCGGALTARCLPLLGKHAANAINSDIEEIRLFAPSFKCFARKKVPGHFILREEFDQAMAKDAQEAGAHILDNCRVKVFNPLPSGDYEIVTDSYEDTVIAKYIILATGFQKNAPGKSLVIREKFEKDYLSMGVVSETPVNNKILEEVNFPGNILAIFFGIMPYGYGWYFVKKRYVNLGIAATALRLKDTGPKKTYNQFVKNLREKGFLPKALELAKERVFPLPFKKTAEKTVFGNVLLVGDSAGFVSPVSGEGIYYAIKGGQLAAEAIHRNLKNNTPLISYQKNWKKAFGNDLNKYAFYMREKFYKSKRWMELAMTLCRHDRKIAKIWVRMIIGTSSYKKAKWKTFLRLPIALFKMIF